MPAGRTSVPSALHVLSAPGVWPPETWLLLITHGSVFISINQTQKLLFKEFYFLSPDRIQVKSFTKFYKV